MAPTTSPLDLAGIKARAEKATEGPWTHCCSGDFNVGCKGQYIWRDSEGANLITAYASDEEPPRRFTERDNRDLAFIAHAREDIPTLLAHVADLQAEVERLQARLAATAPVVDALDHLKELLKGVPDGLHRLRKIHRGACVAVQAFERCVWAWSALDAARRGGGE